MWEVVAAILAALGLKLQNVVVGAIASLVALKFFRELGAWELSITFVGGLAIAAWGGPALAGYAEAGKYELGVVLLCGLFGMAAAGEAMHLVREGGWKDLVPFLRRGGGDNKGSNP